MRSICKTLTEAAALVESLKITRDELAAVTADAYGGGRIQLTPSGFARCFNALNVYRSKLSAHINGKHIHGNFPARGFVFCTVAEITAERWEVMIGPDPDAIAAKPAGLIDGPAPFRLPAPTA